MTPRGALATTGAGDNHGNGGHDELRAQHAHLINDAWQRGKRATLAIGQALCAAKEALPHGTFLKMIEADLPFGPDLAERFMRVARDPKLSNPDTYQHLPQSSQALDKLRRLNEEQLQTLIDQGEIGPTTTVRATDATVDAIVPSKKKKPRPVYCMVEPMDGVCLNYGHFVAAMKRARHERGMSQIDVDFEATWADAYTSKLENPNDPNDGKKAVNDSFDKWLGAVRVGVKVVMVG